MEEKLKNEKAARLEFEKLGNTLESSRISLESFGKNTKLSKHGKRHV
jgi:hypothetical protein